MLRVHVSDGHRTNSIVSALVSKTNFVLVMCELRKCVVSVYLNGFCDFASRFSAAANGKILLLVQWNEGRLNNFDFTDDIAILRKNKDSLCKMSDT